MRVVPLLGEMTEETCKPILEELYGMVAMPEYAFGEDKRLLMPITSAGGDLGQAWAIIDALSMLQSVGVKTTGYAVGHCRSAAVLLLQSFDVRLSSAHTAFLIHGHWAEAHGHAPWISEDLRDMLWGVKEAARFMAKRTGQPVAFWDGVLSGTTTQYLTPKQAKALGLIDAIKLPRV